MRRKNIEIMDKNKRFIVGADFHGSMTALENFLDLAKAYNADKLILLLIKLIKY